LWRGKFYLDILEIPANKSLRPTFEQITQAKSNNLQLLRHHPDLSLRIMQLIMDYTLPNVAALRRCRFHVPLESNKSFQKRAAYGHFGWEVGHFDTRRIGKQRDHAHKLAIEPGSPHIFFSYGEDGVVYHFDLRTQTPTNLFTCLAFGANKSSHSAIITYNT